MTFCFEIANLTHTDEYVQMLYKSVALPVYVKNGKLLSEVLVVNSFRNNDEVLA